MAEDVCGLCGEFLPEGEAVGLSLPGRGPVVMHVRCAWDEGFGEQLAMLAEAERTCAHCREAGGGTVERFFRGMVPATVRASEGTFRVRRRVH